LIVIGFVVLPTFVLILRLRYFKSTNNLFVIGSSCNCNNSFSFIVILRSRDFESTLKLFLLGSYCSCSFIVILSSRDFKSTKNSFVLGSYWSCSRIRRRRSKCHRHRRMRHGCRSCTHPSWLHNRSA